MGHSHHHDHHHHIEGSGKNLLIATILNAVITVAEVIGGIISNSLALLSDALHNLSDTIAVFIAYVANRYSKKPSNEKRTFGYKRVQILAALFNAVVLIVISVYLFYEAYLRLMEPEPIKGLIMLIVATIGLLANLAAVLLLRKDSGKNLNVKAAYIHLLSDTLSSVAVIIGGILIYLYDWYWLDPIITFLIGIYILKETWAILKETIDILMQGTPKNIDIKQVQQDIEGIDRIENIHHLHIWNLDDQSIHFECHVDLNENIDLKSTESIREKIVKLLEEKYKINHVTIQFEHKWCDDKDLIHH
jgi:cobalt-zinc-cadmium efflux system protein